MMTVDTIQHFKISTGEDIICEVIEFDEENYSMNVKNCYALTLQETDEGVRYYSFKPFMVYQDHSRYSQFLNPEHIIATANPDKRVIAQYKAVIEQQMAAEASLDADEEPLTLTLEDFLNTHMTNKYGDSDSSNLVQVNPRNKLH